MTAKRTSRMLAALVGTGALALGGCDGDTSWGSPSSWEKQNPCPLLDAADTTRYVGDPPVTWGRTDSMGWLSCEWKGTGSGRIKLQLWRPPDPDIIIDKARRKFDVAGRTAFVTTETDLSCLMNVQGDSAFLQVEARGSDVDRARPRFCDVVAETAELALAKLGG